MIHKFSRYLLTLVALLAMTTGAWAQSALNVAELTIPDTWQNDNTALSTNDLPGYQVATRNNAIAWTGAPEGYAMLFFDVTSSEIKSATFHNGNYSSDGSTSGLKHSTLYTWKNSASYRFFYTTAPAEPDVKVTISTDQQSAEFDMPSYDATLEYDIVRNLASNTTLNLFIGEEAVTADARLRIKKDGSAYIPVSALSFTLTDAPEGGQTTTLTAAQALAAKLNPVYELKGEGDQWTIVAINETTHLPATLAPGQTYRVSLVAADDAPLYGGEVQAQYLVTLFEGYEVTVPAGEYITYYRDEPLMVDKTQQPYAELYTISEVGTETATLSGPYDAMKTLTPMLVFNSSTDAQTILLIPTTEPDLAVTVAPEFKGTLEATEIAASSATTNNYAFNGKQFVWVKNPISIAPYKCWLDIPTGVATARVINLVFGDATKITNTNYTDLTNGDWYDLNGRKLNAMPTKKGVYIMNGKKVVVK